MLVYSGVIAKIRLYCILTLLNADFQFLVALVWIRVGDRVYDTVDNLEFLCLSISIRDRLYIDYYLKLTPPTIKS